MKQIGLTLTAIVLIVMTAIPATAATKTKTIVPTHTTFTLSTIPGGNGCCFAG